MDDEKPERLATDSAETAQEMGRWTDRYARSRTLGVMASMGVFALLSLALIVFWTLAGEALRSKNPVLFWSCVVGLVPLNGLLI